MIITLSWLKNHLTTSQNLEKIINKLTDIGLEVEGVKEAQNELSDFKIAKVLKAEKHPNADKLKLCDVSIGNNNEITIIYMWVKSGFIFTSQNLRYKRS